MDGKLAGFESFAKGTRPLFIQLTFALRLEGEFKKNEWLARQVTSDDLPRRMSEFQDLQRKIDQFKKMLERALIEETIGVLYISSEEELVVFTDLMLKYKMDFLGVVGAINSRNVELLQKASSSPLATRIYPVDYDASYLYGIKWTDVDGPEPQLATKSSGSGSSSTASSLYGQDRAEEARNIMKLVCFAKRILKATENFLTFLSLSKPSSQGMVELHRSVTNFSIAVDLELLKYEYVCARNYDEINHVKDTLLEYPTWKVKVVILPRLCLEGVAGRLGVEFIHPV